jgi:hypothetical protein
MIEAAKQRADAGGNSTRGGTQVYRGNPLVAGE